MRLYETPEMEALWDKVKPYLNKQYQLLDNAPDEIKKMFEEYMRLSKEQEEFALSL